MSPDERVAAAAARIAAAGRVAWPEVALADDAIAARLAQRLRDDPETQLDELRDADLYLAFALAAHDAAAVRAFERELALPPDSRAPLYRFHAPLNRSRASRSLRRSEPADHPDLTAVIIAIRAAIAEDRRIEPVRCELPVTASVRSAPCRPESIVTGCRSRIA